jgi:hypothetical protein
MWIGCSSYCGNAFKSAAFCGEVDVGFECNGELAPATVMTVTCTCTMAPLLAPKVELCNKGRLGTGKASKI